MTIRISHTHKIRSPLSDYEGDCCAVLFEMKNLPLCGQDFVVFDVGSYYESIDNLSDALKLNRINNHTRARAAFRKLINKPGVDNDIIGFYF